MKERRKKEIEMKYWETRNKPIAILITYKLAMFGYIVVNISCSLVDGYVS